MPRSAANKGTDLDGHRYRRTGDQLQTGADLQSTNTINGGNRALNKALPSWAFPRRAFTIALVLAAPRYMKEQYPKRPNRPAVRRWISVMKPGRYAGETDRQLRVCRGANWYRSMQKRRCPVMSM